MGRRWTWVAWSLAAVFVLSATVALIFEVANGTLQHDTANQTLLLLGFSAFMAVGALIVAHRPGNAIGWLFSTIALLAITGQLASEYAVYAYATRPGSLPAAVLAAWYGSLLWWLVLALALIFTPLLFPTGRLLSPRWRPVAWLAAMATAALTVLTALQVNLGKFGGQVIANPIGITWVQSPDTSPLGTALFGLLLLFIVAAFASLMLRFRRSRGAERQQLKWFTYACALLPLSVLNDVLPEALGAVGDLVFAALIVFLPAATGIAILRHRLYDIDRLINRTLVYGLLTALLAAVYAGLVLVGGQLFGTVGERTPSWAVAGATLAVAALFRPARHRIQQLVDRRFNRRKYNATQTIQAYSLRLRDQVDLDTLSAELLAVVDQTVQPTQALLWLRPTHPVH